MGSKTVQGKERREDAEVTAWGHWQPAKIKEALEERGSLAERDLEAVFRAGLDRQVSRALRV